MRSQNAVFFEEKSKKLYFAKNVTRHCINDTWDKSNQRKKLEFEKKFFPNREFSLNRMTLKKTSI